MDLRYTENYLRFVFTTKCVYLIRWWYKIIIVSRISDELLCEITNLLYNATDSKLNI